MTAAQTEKRSPRNVGARSKTILLIEDDVETRQLLSHFLALEGFEVAEAGNGVEALDYLENVQQACLILLDLMMPVMDGWQFRAVQKQNESFAKIPVIVVSAIAHTDQMRGIDAAAYLSKPVDLDKLLGVIQQHCR